MLLPNKSEYTFWCSFLIQNTNLHKIDRERVSLKLGGLWPEGWGPYSIVPKTIYNHSLIILDDMLLLTNNGSRLIMRCYLISS